VLLSALSTEGASKPSETHPFKQGKTFRLLSTVPIPPQKKHFFRNSGCTDQVIPVIPLQLPSIFIFFKKGHQ